MERYQTIIIGLGAMGSAAAYQLSKRGNNVLGIDQFSPPHTLGSTHGETRVTRQAIGEGAAYTPLALRSYEIWRELEARSGANLLTIAGGLIISDPNSSSSLHGNTNFLKQTIECAEKYGIVHELLTGREIRKRFPPFKVTDQDLGYYEHEAGFLRPECCIDVQLSLAKAQGAQINTDEKVVEFLPEGDGVRVVTELGEYFADKLIVSAGPWVSSFMPKEFSTLFKVYRQTLYWFDIENAEPFEPERFPIFIWTFGSGGFDGIYGFPAIDGSSGGIKVASEEYLTTTTADIVDRNVSEQEKLDMYRRVEACLSGVRNSCLKTTTCLYTVTPDNGFIIDTLPDHPQIIIASPCSGHGFKHSAAIGEILAELATNRTTTLDISSFSLGRF